MANLSETALNAKRIKEQIAQRAGVETNYVNDKSLVEAQKMLQGAKQVSDAGGDPTQADPAALKSLATGEEPVQAKGNSAKDLQKQQKLAMVITAIAPTLLGYAFGGAEGGEIGANVSQKALKDMGDQQTKQAIFERDLAGKKELKEMEIKKDLAVAGERAEDRRTAAERAAEERAWRRRMEEERLNDKKTTAAEKAAAAATLDGRLSKLSKEKQDSVIKSNEALKAVRGMADAYRSGDNTFSVIGDNDFTRNAAWFDEALGRMQSGGAITKDELVTFKAMRPNFKDSAEQQKKKLVDLEAKMQERLKIMGFQPEDFGTERDVVASLYGGPAPTAVAQGGGNPMIDSANAAPAKPDFNKMTTEQIEKYLRGPK